MTTRFLFFPYDLFGSGGTGAGAELLADEIREIIEDNERETVATRADCYTPDIEIDEFLFETGQDYQQWPEDGAKLAQEAIEEDFVFWVSGNHLGALPLYQELGRQAQQGRKVLVVQLDAHLDIHHFADCTSELSHGNFVMHCEPRPPLVNVGHRELLLPEDHIADYYQATIPASRLCLEPEDAWKEMASWCSEAEAIYLDLDCDAIDPTFFPAVKQPVPFGLTLHQVLQVIHRCWSDKVKGVMVSEFLPDRDVGDKSLSTLVWLIEHLLLLRYEK